MYGVIKLHAVSKLDHCYLRMHRMLSNILKKSFLMYSVYALMKSSLLRNSSTRVLDVANLARQGSYSQQIIQTSPAKHQIVNMSGASETSGAEEKAEIVWDGKQKLFRTTDGKAYLSYTVRQSTTSGEKKPDILDLQHTFVPGSFRGQGMAGKLCVAAFEHAKEKGFLVQPTCFYVSDTFLPRNPKWNDLVVKDGAISGL